MSRTRMSVFGARAHLQGVQVVDHDSDRPADARQVGEEPRQRAAAAAAAAGENVEWPVP